jgi:hypothetical protein
LVAPRGAARAAVEMGADQVVLFTDLASPVPNAIYQRIALSAGVLGRVP